MSILNFLKIRNILDLFNDEHYKKRIPSIYNQDLYITSDQVKKTCDNISKYNISKNILNGQEFETFIKKLRKYSFSISDIEKMRSGKSINVVFINKDILQIIYNNVKSDTLYTPKEIFEEYKEIYTHLKGLKGSMCRNNSDTMKLSELYIEFNGSWFPTKNELIQPVADDNQCLPYKDVNWKELPLDTKVGLKGLMVPWCVLEFFPSKIYFI